MINIQEELAYYEQLRVGAKVEEKDVLEKIDQKLEKVDKVAKMQQKSYHALEDLLETIEQQQEEAMQKGNHTQSFLASMMSLLDLFDEIDRFCYTSEQEVLRQQFKLQRDKVQVILAKVGITRIDYTLEKQLFDASIHSAVQTVCEHEKEDQEITQVLKSGYIYEQKVIRKAQVIVNTREKGLDNETYSRD